MRVLVRALAIVLVVLSASVSAQTGPAPGAPGVRVSTKYEYYTHIVDLKAERTGP